MDYTPSDVRDTRNMLLAFRWTVPKSFWIVRVDGSLIFELALLKETGSTGWQSLCLDLMPLLCDEERYIVSGLANRAPVLWLIDLMFEGSNFFL